MRSTSSAVACGPAITTAGSPGSSRISRKTTVATPSSVGIATSSRRITYVITPRLPRRFPSYASDTPYGLARLARGRRDGVGSAGFARAFELFWPSPKRCPSGGGPDPPHEIYDFVGTPREGEPWFPLLGDHAATTP